MKIDFELDSKQEFYHQETQRALQWLCTIWDAEKKGWAWVQFIHPNEQNTAEVISTLIDYIEELSEAEIDIIVESAKHWLLDNSRPKISIDFSWVLLALQKIRTCPQVSCKLDMQQVDQAAKYCADWLCRHRNDEQAGSITRLQDNDGIKGCGWGDNDTEISGTIRTALAVTVLNREVRYLCDRKEALEAAGQTEAAAALDKEAEPYRVAAQKGLQWLLSVQNADGGWGNLDKRCVNNNYQVNHSFTYLDLKYQCNSNPASTGYVMIALKEAHPDDYDKYLSKASDYLHKSQKPNGGWSVFTEIGVREGLRYTFRHFSTAWAIQGMIVSHVVEYNDECIINGFSYLASLQDPNYGGWKSSSNADNYTWATCNALDTIRLLKNNLSSVKAQNFLKIVCEWWEMKKESANYSIKIKKSYFAFNGPTGLAFCVIFSLMISLMLYLVYNLISPIMVNQTQLLTKMVYSVLTILTALILGLPWIVYVKNVFRKQVDGWIDAIGWVYGIITGFVLVLYQFII